MAIDLRSGVDQPPTEARTITYGSATVAATEVRQECLSAGQAELTVDGGTVEGSLDLSNVDLSHALTFRGTTFSNTVQLANANTRSVIFKDCKFNDGINGNGVTVNGDLIFFSCDINGHLRTPASESRAATVWLSEATVEGRLLMKETTITPTTLDGEREPRAIHADRLRLRSNLRMTQGFRADGEIRLIGAVIDGSVDLTSVHISSDELAVNLGEARIGGTLFVLPGPGGQRPSIEGQFDLSGTTVEGQVLIVAADFSPSSEQRSYYRNKRQADLTFSAVRAQLHGDVDFVDQCSMGGRLSLSGAEITGHCYLNDLVVDHDGDGYSIDLRNLNVDAGFNFAGKSGPVRLQNASINGDLILDHAHITGTEAEPRTISARNLNVQGDLSMIQARFVGLTDFKLTRISGDFRAYAAELTYAAGRQRKHVDLALRLSSATIEGSLLLASRFKANGTVRLNRINVNGGLDCTNGTFETPGGKAITMFLSSFRSGCHMHWTVNGNIEAVGMKTTMLDDEPDNWGDGYDIRGMVYDQLADDDVNARLQWLHSEKATVGSDEFARLADYYRRAGRSADMARVQIARRRALRKAPGGPSGFTSYWDRFLDLAIGYGFRSNRMAVVLLALIAMTTAALLLPTADDIMVAVDENNVVYSPTGVRLTNESGEEEFISVRDCDGGRVRCFHALAYAVDTVVPLIDLHQRSTWYPDRSAPWGRTYERLLYAAVLLGWMASSTFVFGLAQGFGNRDGGGP